MLDHDPISMNKQLDYDPINAFLRSSTKYVLCTRYGWRTPAARYHIYSLAACPRKRSETNRVMEILQKRVPFDNVIHRQFRLPHVWFQTVLKLENKVNTKQKRVHVIFELVTVESLKNLSFILRPSAWFHTSNSPYAHICLLANRTVFRSCWSAQTCTSMLMSPQN